MLKHMTAPPMFERDPYRQEVRKALSLPTASSNCCLPMDMLAADACSSGMLQLVCSYGWCEALAAGICRMIMGLQGTEARSLLISAACPVATDSGQCLLGASAPPLEAVVHPQPRYNIPTADHSRRRPADMLSLHGARDPA